MPVLTGYLIDLTDREGERWHQLSVSSAGDGPTQVAWSSEHGLSPRETQVLLLIAQGYSNEGIARHLFLSINSVKTYVRTAYYKIGAQRRVQAALWVHQHITSSVP
ncbi:response regulator transcription factor [Nocardioides aurantiacus]|uniref:response regulator transcription factor n=1 Tax=Nocardioides aurantiacus TaxID=86796 RepID=UPI001FE55967|nr:LuxR C-terminal-related transcriptional regulator [Nocardioides aurantiacus]